MTDHHDVASDLAERRARWDERHREGDFEGSGPNPTLVAAMDGLRPGSVLELGSGGGTNAVWMAAKGWRVTAVDLSPVGLAAGTARARDAGVSVEWVERDLLTWSPPHEAFDLVVAVYLQLPAVERRRVYAAGLAAVAPGGRMIVVAHDPINVTEGLGGPQDQERLFTAAALAAEIVPADAHLVVERSDVVRRDPVPRRAPIDALLVIRRPGSQETRS